MATQHRMAVKTSKNIQAILIAIEALSATVGNLTTMTTNIEPVELTAEFADSDILDEIKGAQRQMAETMQQIANANALAITGLKEEIVTLREELKPKKRGRKPSVD